MDLDDHFIPVNWEYIQKILQSTTEVICWVQFLIISATDKAMSWQCLFLLDHFFPIRLLLSLRKDFNLQLESQSHLFTSEMCVNRLLTWRQTAAVPQDSELNVTPLKQYSRRGRLKLAERDPCGTTRLLLRSRNMADLSLRRPDKGQVCAHYVCSVSAGSRGSETLKGRLDVLTRGF